MTAAPSPADDTDSSVDSSDDTALLDVLGGSVARTILATARGEAATADELAAACDVSESTVYRHLNGLVEAGLVEKSRSQGTPVYETAVGRVTVEVGKDGLSVEPDRRSPDEEFTAALEAVLARLDVRQVAYDLDAGTVDVTVGFQPEYAADVLSLCDRYVDADPSAGVARAGPGDATDGELYVDE
jgi:DNA-binding transcriptional ArsR family regulator